MWIQILSSEVPWDDSEKWWTIPATQENTSQLIHQILESLSSYSFIKINQEGIFINTSWLRSSEELVTFLDGLFMNSYYIVWMDYERVAKLILNISHYDSKEIKIGNSIEFLSENRSEKYHKPTIFKWLQAEYTFSPLSEDQEIDGKMTEVKVVLNIDEFIAMMWKYGIKFWLQISQISQAISDGKTQRVLIADYLPATPGKDAYLQSLEFFWQDFGIPETGLWNKLDLKRCKRTYSEIPKGTKLYKKQDMQEWVPGMNIFGQIILPDISPKDLDMYKFAWEGIEIIEEGSEQYFVSTISWFVTPPQGTYTSKESWESQGEYVRVPISQLKNQVKVTSHIELWTIWPSTGNIHTDYWVSITGIESWYEVVAGNILSTWLVNGGILATTWDINVKWNIMGNYSQSWLDESDISHQVISQKWSIFVDGRVFSHAALYALQGNINISMAEMSIIAWKNIHISQVRGAIIFWENIEIDVMTDCVVIATGNVSIKSMWVKKHQENIIFIVKPEDYEKKAQEVAAQIEEITTKSEKIQKIVEKLTQENEQIRIDERVAIVWPIIKKMKEKILLTQQEIQMLQEHKLWFDTALAQFKSNQKKLWELGNMSKQVIESLQSLWATYQQLSEFSKLKQPELKVQLNQWPAKLVYISLPEYTNFSSISFKRIQELCAYNTVLQERKFIVQDIQNLPTGTFQI